MWDKMRIWSRKTGHDPRTGFSAIRLEAPDLFRGLLPWTACSVSKR